MVNQLTNIHKLENYWVCFVSATITERKQAQYGVKCCWNENVIEPVLQCLLVDFIKVFPLEV